MTKNQTLTVEQIPAGQLTYIPEGKRQTRKIKELAESIKTRGIIQPLLVTFEGEVAGKGKYLIRRGRRRYEAGKLAGLTDYPCLVTAAGTADAELDIIENTQREPYTAIELYDQALQLHPEAKKGATPELIQAVAGSLGISALEAQRILNIGKMAKPVTDALAAGEISLGLALLTLNIQDQKQVLPFLKICKEDHPSVRAAADWVREHTRGENRLDHDCPFDTKDCARCPKKGGADPSLFEDPDPDHKNVCWDKSCYDKKAGEAVQIVVDKAKELGLAGIKPAKEDYDYWDHTVYGKVKTVDPEKCKVCKVVLVGKKDRGFNIVCPDSCQNIRSTRGGSSDSGRESKPKSDKPVIERPKAEKVAYMKEKLDLASRKFMRAYFIDIQGATKDDPYMGPTFIKEQRPTDPWRVAWYLGCKSGQNPFRLDDFYFEKDSPKEDAKNPLLAKPGLEAFLKIVMMPEHVNRCALTLSMNDQSGRGPEDIDQDVELLYGIKDFCCSHYAEILQLLGKSAKAVLESLGGWRPEWAKNAKASAPTKAEPAGAPVAKGKKARKAAKK